MPEDERPERERDPQMAVEHHLIEPKRVEPAPQPGGQPNRRCAGSRAEDRGDPRAPGFQEGRQRRLAEQAGDGVNDRDQGDGHRAIGDERGQREGQARQAGVAQAARVGEPLAAPEDQRREQRDAAVELRYPQPKARREGV